MTMILKKATIGSHEIILSWDKHDFLIVTVWKIESCKDGSTSYYKEASRYFGNMEKEAKRSFAYYVRKYRKEADY